MSLKPGTQVKAERLKLSLIVKEKLGEGGQGAVYRVRSTRGEYAVKWYNTAQATSGQREAIRKLVQAGPPKGASEQRFIWPLDVVTMNGAKQFGYLMPLIDRKRYGELGEVWANLKPAPSFKALCEISFQAANSYRALHLSGYCYRDISSGNLMFNSKTGDVLICDNDNVGINNQSDFQVWGTMEYMAPELVRGEANPTSQTDLHSLAVLLFQLWVWHHPMHGELEYQIRSWDLPAKRRVYGELPIFIFDPVNRRNRLPADPAYNTARTRWNYLPKSLQTRFARAFTTGLKSPGQRITEGEWQNLFLQLKDGIIACPNCRAENIWDTNASRLTCWHCKRSIPVPPKLTITHARGQQAVLLTRGARVLERHRTPGANEKVIGEVVQNPANPKIWGIRNRTTETWQATFPNGTTRTIPPQRSAPINNGLILQMGNIKGRIKA